MAAPPSQLYAIARSVYQTIWKQRVECHPSRLSSSKPPTSKPGTPSSLASSPTNPSAPIVIAVPPDVQQGPAESGTDLPSQADFLLFWCKGLVQIVLTPSDTFGDGSKDLATDEKRTTAVLDEHTTAVLALLRDAGVSEDQLVVVRTAMSAAPVKPVATLVKPLLEALDNLYDQFSTHSILFKGMDVPFEYDPTPKQERRCRTAAFKEEADGFRQHVGRAIAAMEELNRTLCDEDPDVGILKELSFSFSTEEPKLLPCRDFPAL